jgi:predicted transcriptional regulator
MANLTIEMLDELVRSLEGIAAAQRKSLQQLALD